MCWIIKDVFEDLYSVKAAGLAINQLLLICFAREL